MNLKTLAFALALLAPVSAQAASHNEAAAPKKECCCEKDAAGKMKCCDKMKGDAKGDAHAGHDMSGADAK